ncbi:MAG: 2-phospho-L-lactate guanylyltransferase [Halobacteria archaeon]|nr:2-phospho-L-lactate guanylyltransferase [Halobacteria archaeon]
MIVYIPFKPQNPKTRLSPVLSQEERSEFSLAMLKDVYDAVAETGHRPIVLSTRELSSDLRTRVSPKELTPAVNSVLDEVPVSIVMADLGIATSQSLERLFNSEADLAIVPGRGGGTNAFVTRSQSFEVDYHGTSYLDHLRIARENDLEIDEVDSFRLSTDMDEPDDLVEVLMHSRGRARDYLEDRFELVVEEEDEKTRVGLRRL